MKNPIIKKVPVDRLGEWPSDPWRIDMRDEPDGPDNPSASGWVFEIQAKFGKMAPPAIQGPQYCRWYFPGYRRYEASAVKTALVKRCHKEGVTFVYIFRQIRPMSTERVRMIQKFNAKLRVERGQIETAA